MKCPRDGTILKPVQIIGIELDKCHHCNGLWCDRGELDKLRDSRQHGLEEIIEQEYGNPEYMKHQTDGYMRCPRCGGRLTAHNYSYVAPVTVDTCQDCLGIWLDNGELDHIAGQKNSLEQAASSGKLADFLGRFSKTMTQ